MTLGDSGADLLHVRIASTMPMNPFGWRPNARPIVVVASTRNTTSIIGHCTNVPSLQAPLRHTHWLMVVHDAASGFTSHVFTAHVSAKPLTLNGCQ